MMSIRFLDETLWAILETKRVSYIHPQLPHGKTKPISRIGNLERGENALCGIGLVVHEEELDVPDVADEERLVARRGHVLGLAVGAITNLDSSVLALLRRFAPIP
jgi:hypothetical protein